MTLLRSLDLLVPFGFTGSLSLGPLREVESARGVCCGLVDVNLVDVTVVEGYSRNDEDRKEGTVTCSQ